MEPQHNPAEDLNYETMREGYTRVMQMRDGKWLAVKKLGGFKAVTGDTREEALAKLNEAV